MFPETMDAADRAPYPSHYEADVPLKDGSTAHIRPVRPEDAGALRALLEGLSPHSLFLRYHRRVAQIEDEEVARFTDVDYADSLALVATLPGPAGERIAAVALYSRTEADRAEVAFVVAEEQHGLGIATQLLDALAAAARDNGINVFEADVLGENQEMMDVFRDSGYPVESRLKYGTYHVHVGVKKEGEPRWAEGTESG
jgi:GNAT superfamily N-acetyltransferase